MFFSFVGEGVSQINQSGNNSLGCSANGVSYCQKTESIFAFIMVVTTSRVRIMENPFVLGEQSNKGSRENVKDEERWGMLDGKRQI